MPGLALRHITHRFNGLTVLDDVSLQIAPGELVCLLGPSGCGKSTLLRLAAGLEPLQHGQVEIDDRSVAKGGDLRQIPPEKRGVGLMFQDYALFPHLNIFDNVRFGIRKRDWGRLSWVKQALRDVELADFAERFPHTLSGGQQQRIALLRALAPSPRVILLDEPFSGLDENLRKQVRTETLKILSEVQIAALMVTHDPEEAMFLADRIVVMRAGRILQAAAPVEVYRSPADPFVARMFGPTNEFHVEVRGGFAQTPLGPVAAPGLADGEPALVLVRAEAIKVVGGGAADGVRQPSKPGSAPTVLVEVRRARPLGASTYLELDVPGPADAFGAVSETLVQAEIPGMHVLGAGSSLAVRLNPALTHVFPIPGVAGAGGAGGGGPCAGSRPRPASGDDAQL